MLQVSVFENKGVYFSFVNINESGNFLIWRTIIRPPFHIRVAGLGSEDAVERRRVIYGCRQEPGHSFTWYI